MSLLDDLRNLLARHLAHTQSQTQQGAVRWIEDHLNRLDAVASSDIAAGEAKVHEILGELYAATGAPDGTAPTTPATPAAPDVPSTPAEPTTVDEPGPEASEPAPANPTSMGAPAAEPAPATEDVPAPAETGDAPADTTPAA